MMKKKKNKEKIVEIKKNKRYYTFANRVTIKTILCIAFLILSILFINLGLRINVDSNLRYYQTSNLDYNVNLKNNNYYDKNRLGKDMQYIASLIDTIDVNFDYDFKTSEKLNYKYSYYVDALVKVNDENTSNVIFSKKEKISDEKTINMTDSDNFSINEKVKVDYDKYNSMIKSFKSEYGINAKSDLTLSLYVKIMDDGGKELKTLKANNTMNIIIPLTEQMINIKMDYKEINNSDTLITHTNFKIHNKVLFIIGILFALFSLISLINLLKFLNKLNRKKTTYDKVLRKILREYDRIIVESRKGIIIDKSQEIIDVKSFGELLDARDNLEKPIVFNEIHKGQKAVFVVKNNYEVYRYILKLIDLENK